MLLLLMFERDFNRLGHGSVVEKIEEEEEEEEEMKKKNKKNRRKIAFFFYFILLFKIRNRLISWEGWGTLGKWGR